MLNFLGDIGRNRGVVCYEREDDAKRAIDELDGREFNGRDVKLTYKVRSSLTNWYSSLLPVGS